MGTKYFDSSKGYEIKAARLDGKEYMRERTLPFCFDPKHDYLADVEELCPTYEVPKIDHNPLMPGVAFSDARGTREVVIPGTNTRNTMKYFPYVRAVDLQGNVHPLSISTIRPYPDPQDRLRHEGIDGCGTESRVKDEKRRKGWLILDPSEWMNGRTGQEYLAWALAVAEKRRLANEAWQDREAEIEVPKAQKRYLAEQAKYQNEVTSGLVDQVTKAVLASQQAQPAVNIAEIVQAAVKAALEAQGQVKGKRVE